MQNMKQQYVKAYTRNIATECRHNVSGSVQGCKQKHLLGQYNFVGGIVTSPFCSLVCLEPKAMGTCTIKRDGCNSSRVQSLGCSVVYFVHIHPSCTPDGSDLSFTGRQSIRPDFRSFFNADVTPRHHCHRLCIHLSFQYRGKGPDILVFGVSVSRCARPDQKQMRSERLYSAQRMARKLSSYIMIQD